MIYKAAAIGIIIAILAIQGWRIDCAQKDAAQYRISYNETMTALSQLRQDLQHTQKILVAREDAKNDTAQKTDNHKSNLRAISATKASVSNWADTRLPDDVRGMLTTSSGTDGSTVRSPGYPNATNANTSVKWTD